MNTNYRKSSIHILIPSNYVGRNIMKIITAESIMLLCSGTGIIENLQFLFLLSHVLYSVFSKMGQFVKKTSKNRNL